MLHMVACFGSVRFARRESGVGVLALLLEETPGAITHAAFSRSHAENARCDRQREYEEFRLACRGDSSCECPCRSARP